MNEEELKRLWQAEDHSAPKIDFAALDKSLNDWHEKLRRKVRAEIPVQIAMVALSFGLVFYSPRLIFFALGVAALGAWYIPELRRLSRQETSSSAAAASDVREALNRKLATMKRYFRRTRIALYVFSPILIPVAFWGLGHFDHQGIGFGVYALSVGFFTLFYEAAAILINEIFFALTYKPAYKELKELLRQLDETSGQ